MDKKKKLFLDDLLELYKKHNISISHEDGHGAFILEDYESFNVEWIKRAEVNFK